MLTWNSEAELVSMTRVAYICGICILGHSNACLLTAWGHTGLDLDWASKYSVTVTVTFVLLESAAQETVL